MTGKKSLVMSIKVLLMLYAGLHGNVDLSFWHAVLTVLSLCCQEDVSRNLVKMV